MKKYSNQGRLFIIAHPNRKGVALIFTLTVVALLSVLVIAFLAKNMTARRISFSSAGQARADLLAQGALDTIVGDLRQEIRAGSDGTSTTYKQGNVWIYKPVNAQAMMPERVGTDATIPNLVKRSVAATPFWASTAYAGSVISPIRAIAVNSEADPSINGQYISKKRWNKSYLLGDTVPSKFVSPDWVLISRKGPFADATKLPALSQLKDDKVGNEDYVIGRFSYLVFDEGGLLDVNVAGNGLTSTENAKRGLLHQAALSAIPGFSDPASFINWRNAATKTDSTYLFKGTNTFLEAAAGDQRFISRQDLLGFVSANSSVISTTALPYLGTFSRELNAPSWAPDKNAADFGGSATYAYKDNINNTTAVNRFVANVRFPSSTPVDKIITSYKTDGTTFTYMVNAGDSLVQRRFPLQRLSWLGKSGTQNGGSAASVKACFGLESDSANYRWKYVGAYGSITQAKIKTLEEVANRWSAGTTTLDPLESVREPNFFELLKAGILSGSIGMTLGPVVSVSGAVYSLPDKPPYNATAKSYNSNTVASFSMSDGQIIQIGLNIIDQWDADSFPARVLFGTGSGKTQFEFYGQESLPYVYRVGVTPYRPINNFGSANGDPVNRSMYDAWYEPVLWCPSQTSIATVDEPAQFRFTTFHDAYVNVAYKKLDPATGNTVNAATNLKCTRGSAAAGADKPVFSKGTLTSLGLATKDPQLLRDLKNKGALVTVGRPEMSYAADSSTNPNDDYLGFWAGEVRLEAKAVDSNAILGTTTMNSGHFGMPSGAEGGPEMILEADYSGSGLWKTIQYWNYGWTGGTFFGASAYSNKFLNTQARDKSLGLNDPRSSRFGVHDHIFNSDKFLNDFTPYTNFWSSSKNFLFGWNPIEANFNPNSSASRSAYRYGDNSTSGGPSYTDPDGVMRAADGYWNSGGNNTLPTAANADYRPVQLNRSFRSVGEMAYSFRDLPWKSLDFSTSRSADAGLLDLFCLNDPDAATGLVAGKINLNTAQPKTLQALLTGAGRVESSPSVQQVDESATPKASTIAQALSLMTTAAPLQNKSELVTRFMSDAVFAPTVTTTQIKAQKEVVIRALAEAGQTRTWNLMIDVVAQVGRYAPGAADLKNFTVDGEKRYWLHIAVDRYTGEIVDQQLEVVQE